jgi:hypothetical protein
VRNGLNETNILVGEIQILTLLKRIRDKLLDSEETSPDYKKFLEGSPFRKYDPYLELLYATEVPLIKLDRYYKDFQKIFKHYHEDFRSKIEAAQRGAILKALDSIDEEFGFDPRELVTEAVLRQVEASVISRILEIPEELKPAAEEPIEQQGRFDKFKNPEETDFRKVLRSEEPVPVDAEEHEQGRLDRYNNPDETDFRKAYRNTDEKISEYSFSVASTLVPIIDFVNHSNDLVNSSFDVDRLNKDVLLKIDGAKMQGLHGEVELLITYSEVEDVFKFVHSYGFIPKSSKTPILYQHLLDRDYLLKYSVKKEGSEHNLGVFLKWFSIQPNVQFVIEYASNGEIKDVFVNLDENYFPFAFTKGLKYVPERAFAIFKELGDVEAEEDEKVELSDEYIHELIGLLESNQNDIIESCGLTPYVHPDVDEAESITIDTIIQNTPDDEVNNLIGEFIDFLVIYFQQRLEVLKGFLELEADHKPSTVVQLVKFEVELLERFILKTSKLQSADDKVENLVIGADEVDEQWLKNRMRPITLPAEAVKLLNQKFTLQALKDLTLSRGEENDVSYEAV